MGTYPTLVLRLCDARRQPEVDSVSVRDTQRQKLYNWESGLPDSDELSLDECETLAHAAYDVYGVVSKPRIKDGRGTTWARGSMSTINLPKWARTKRTVLHESAHGIVQRTVRSDVAVHGAEFVAIYIELLERFKIGHGPDLRRSARAVHLKVALDAACKPPAPRALKTYQAALARERAAKREWKAASAALAEARNGLGR